MTMDATNDTLIVLEGGPEAGGDATPDAGGDAETRPEGGGGRCVVGRACTDDRQCRPDNRCQVDVAEAFMVPDSPVYNEDGTMRMETRPFKFFQGGYCMPAVALDPASGFAMTCDPDDPMDTTCGDCGTCVPLFRATDGTLVTACLRTCEYKLTDNDVCRDGYECTPSGYCIDGCSSDIECRTYFADVTGDGEPEWVYDPESDGTCNLSTYRCEHSGTMDAEAGDPCIKDSQCEANGSCITEDRGWPGGYCTKFRCDVAGNGCAGDGKCMDLGIQACVQPCDVGGGADPADMNTWYDARGGCREGYACVWDGDSMGAGNGGCVPGSFNDVRTPNIGQPCETDEDCWSPFGLGRCLGPEFGFPNGYCTIFNCHAPGLPTDADGNPTVCGSGSQCVQVTRDGLTLCMNECSTGADCPSGMGCIPLTMDASGPKACFLGCGADTDCPPTDRCVIEPGMMAGTCQKRMPGICRGDMDCAADEVCLGETADAFGQCRPAGSCLTDDDCPAGQSCEGAMGTTPGSCMAPMMGDAGMADGGVPEGGMAEAGAMEAGG